MSYTQFGTISQFLAIRDNPGAKGMTNSKLLTGILLMGYRI